MTNYLKNKVLDSNLSSAYIALFNSSGEVVASSYQRQSTTFTAANEGQVSNDAEILFSIASESWGAITDVGIFDSQVDGNMLFKAPAEFVKTIDVSSQYKIPKNYLIIRLR